MIFLIINPFTKQAATTEEKSDAQNPQVTSFTSDRKRNSSGFFFIRSHSSKESAWNRPLSSPHTVEGTGENPTSENLLA